MRRTFKFRLLPNATQRLTLEYVLEDSRETYNAALQERRGAWELCRKRITLYDQYKELTELRKNPAFATIACDIQREPLRRIDAAFKTFFRRTKTGANVGYPRFKPQTRYDSFAWTNGSYAIRFIGNKLSIPSLGRIRTRGGRPISGSPKICTIKREGSHWTASVACAVGSAPRKRTVRRAVGIDVGLASLVTLSDGQIIDNPRWTKQYEDNIAYSARIMARKQRNSKNRQRAKEVLRRTHQRAANARKNYLHHISKWLVSNYDLIAYENLNIKGMAKSSFAKSIMDAAWSILLFQICYKAESAGAYAIAVNPRGTTQGCSGCGEIVPKKIWHRMHDCPKCGLLLTRDHNAGLNILALGMSAAGLSPSKRLQEKCI